MQMRIYTVKTATLTIFNSTLTLYKVNLHHCGSFKNVHLLSHYHAMKSNTDKKHLKYQPLLIGQRQLSIEFFITSSA